MDDVPLEAMYRIRLVEMQCFPTTDAILARIHIQHRGRYMLVGLHTHWLNVGDSMEILTRMWLDATRKVMVNTVPKSGNYFESNACQITSEGRVTLVTRHVQKNILHFQLVFVTVGDKKYLQIPVGDDAWNNFNRLYNVFG